jgi:hypothetical protein
MDVIPLSFNVSELVLKLSMLSTTNNNNGRKNLLASGRIDFLNNFLREMLLVMPAVIPMILFLM